MSRLAWFLCLALVVVAASGARVLDPEKAAPESRKGGEKKKQPRKGAGKKQGKGSETKAASEAAAGKKQRRRPEETEGLHRIETYGAPRLEVLKTSNDTEAAAFLEAWSSAKEFGLFLLMVPDSRGFFPRRVGLVGIARGSRVLLFDLKPHLRKDPRPLPRQLGRFLADAGHTFFGLGLRDPAAHLAFEFDAVARCVDYRVRGWKQMRIEGGLFKLAKLYFGTSFRRRPNLRELKGQALYAYLEWAVLEYFMAFYGKPEESWVLKEAELFAYGPRSVRVQNPKHEWEKAKDEWLRLKEERSEERLRKALEMQWYWEPEDVKLQGREEGVEEEAAAGSKQVQWSWDSAQMSKKVKMKRSEWRDTPAWAKKPTKPGKSAKAKAGRAAKAKSK